MKRHPLSSILTALAMQLGAGAVTPDMIGALGTGQRQGKRRAGRSAGSYGRGLMNHFNKARREAEQKRQKAAFAPRDAHGAVTRTGGPDPVTGARRTWLAGVSAQRGY